jgi:ACT domain-containing protein
MSQLTEKDIRRLAEEAVRQLGESATPQAVETVVREALGRIEQTGAKPAVAAPQIQREKPQSGSRIIVTAFGRNRSGILAGLTGVLAQHTCDILDLSQKLMQDFFTVMLLVDIANGKTDFEGIKNALVKKGEELDLKVIIQHEEIFNAMHRV